MKTLLTLFLFSLCFGTMAQRSSSKHVTTDGRQLRIRIDLEQVGRAVHYNRSFNIENMTGAEVKALENQVVDSLNQVMADQSKQVAATTRRFTERTRRTNKDDYVTHSSTYSGSALANAEASTTSTLSSSDTTPTSVLVREDKENGRLWMQYTFEKDGEELIIERTANVIGKSEQEKKTIIKETERTFGIKLGNQ